MDEGRAVDSSRKVHIVQVEFKGFRAFFLSRCAELQLVCSTAFVEVAGDFAVEVVTLASDADLSWGEKVKKYGALGGTFIRKSRSELGVES